MALRAPRLLLRTEPIATFLRPSFWDLAGREISTIPIQMQPQAISAFDFAAQLNGAAIDTVRSVSVSYYGVFRSLASQITLSGYESGASSDATLYEDQEYYTPSLNSVWWAPPNSKAYISVSNSSTGPETVSFVVNGVARLLNLPSRGSYLAELPAPDNQDHLASAAISSSAANGVIRATGFVALPGGSYISTVRFVDPGVLLSGSLAATGLSLKENQYVLAVKNLKAVSESITPTLFFHAPGMPPASLAPVTLAPGQVSSISVSSSETPVSDVVAVKLSSSGGAGSFLASLSTMPDSKLQLAASPPFRDVQTEESGTGGYPWRLDGDFETHVYITNTTSEPKIVFARITAANQPDYVPGATQLAPGQTAEYDLRALRDQHISDSLGNTMSPNVTTGQFIWGLQAQATDDHGVLGRASMISATQKTLRSYSCYSCSCSYALSQISMIIPDPSINPNDFQNVSTLGYYSSPCAGTSVPPNSPITPGYNSYDAAMITMANGNPATMHAVGAGYSGLQASSGGGQILFNQGSCVYQSENLTSSGSVTIADQTPVLSGIDPSDWPAGKTTNVTFTGDYLGNGSPVLNFNPGAGLSYSLVSANDTTIVANVTVAAGTPTENVNVSVTSQGYSGQGFNPMGGSQPATSSTVFATVITPPPNSPQITVVAWLNPAAVTLPSGASAPIVSDLQNDTDPHARACIGQMLAFAADGLTGKTVVSNDANTAADKAYALAWLVKNSGNAQPPTTLNPETFKTNLLSYRMIISWGAGESLHQMGATPLPCGSSVHFPGWVLQGHEYTPDSGIVGTGTATGLEFMMEEGRIDAAGRQVNAYLTGNTTPYIWDVIKFDSQGHWQTTDHATFPSYWTYKNGELEPLGPNQYSQSSVAAFAAMNENSSRRTFQQLQSQ